MNNPEIHRIIAVSRDLEAKGFKMNTVVVVSNAGRNEWPLGHKR